MKKAFLWLKNQYLPPNLAIFISKLKYFPRNSTIFETQGKNSRKIENSRLKLNDFDQKTQGTGGFYHLCPRENRTKKACTIRTRSTCSAVPNTNNPTYAC